jgi:hypothetical protein
MFTKHARTKRNLINRERDHIIPDKLLAVSPDNELFYFRVKHQSHVTEKMQEIYRYEL